MCEKEQVDLLLIAGDLFHRQPLLRELKEVDYLLSSLTHTQVVMCAGNHDYIKHNSYYKTFQWCDHVHMILQSELTCVELPGIDTAVYGLSYERKEITEARYNVDPRSTSCTHKILLAHGGDEKHIPFKKVLLLEKGYDYIALGHIHKPQEVVGERMAYAGTLEPVDKIDTGVHGYRKGIIIDHRCKSEFVPFAKREYVSLNVQVNKEMTGFAIRNRISELMEERGIQHMYRIVLTGYRAPELNLDYRAMDRYGNIIDILDHTRPAYDFEKLKRLNKDNLIGHYIQSFSGEEETSIEYEALCEGINALMETKRGQ